ncbi:MAG: hypothetical protein KJ822_11955 [Proteobacteria bacterium]|nr:hypothetical protein [Pseudomonadota bacterium]MBU4356045.1 hypothetical protein [Pseudomonadota bacterium]
MQIVKSNLQDYLEVVAGDITDPFGVARALAGCEVVFHPAAFTAILHS